MERFRANRRLLVFSLVGVLLCGGALGYRLSRSRHGLAGVWKGWAYTRDGAQYVINEGFGQFCIVLEDGGQYAENGNGTEGIWTRTGNQIILHPKTINGLTPEENRKRYPGRNGKRSVILERLIRDRMQPMSVEYRPAEDHLVFDEPTIRYEYERL